MPSTGNVARHGAGSRQSGHAPDSGRRCITDEQRAARLGGLATSAPWAPLVAFMVASPLTSPAELLVSAGLFGWPFALIFFLGTIAIGLAAGAVTARIERSGWLDGQPRVTFDHTLPSAERVVDDARQRATEVAARARPTDATDRQLAIAASALHDYVTRLRTDASGYEAVYRAP